MKYLGDFIENFPRLYDYAKELNTTNLETTISIKTHNNTISGKKKCYGHLYMP